MSNLSNGNGNSKGSPIMYFIDATNVCYWKDTNNPSLSPLLHLVIHLRRELNQSFFCIFDANTIYKIPDHEKEIYNNLLKYPEFFYKVAGGKRADDFVLELADKYDAPVISNDNYNGEQYEKYKWKDRDYQPQRLFMGEVIPVMGNHHLILSDLDIHLVLNQPVDTLYSILTQLLTTSSANRKAGKVKFFNAHEGWGQITYTADIYFHRSVVPFGNELGKDQSIEFTIGQNEKGACVSQIFMVAPKEKTRIGYIESYDEAKEIGSIKTIDEDQTSTMFFYKSYFGDNIDPAQISAGKIVEFTKSKNKHGDCARDIIILDDTTTGKLLKIQRKRLQKMDGMMEQFTKLQTAYEQKQQEWKRIEEKSTDLRKLEEMLKARDNTILQVKKQRDEFKEKLRLLNGGELPELSPEMQKAESSLTEPTPEVLPQQKTENGTPATQNLQQPIKGDKQQPQKQQNKQQSEKQQTAKNNQNATQNPKKQPTTQPTPLVEESIATEPLTTTKPEQPAIPEPIEKIPGLIVLPKKQSEQPKKEIQPTEKQIPAAELPSETQNTASDVPQTVAPTSESVAPKTGLIILPKKQNNPPAQTPTTEPKPQEEKKQPAVLSEQPAVPTELPAASNTTPPATPTQKTNNGQSNNNKPNKKEPTGKQPQKEKEKHKQQPQPNSNAKPVQPQPELPIPSSPVSLTDTNPPRPTKEQLEVQHKNEKKTPVPTAKPTTKPTVPPPSKHEPKEENNSRQRWWNTLDEEWKKAFNVTLGKGESTDSPSNEELDSLLNTTKLNFYRTSKHRLTFKLSSLEGIKLLPKLQAINVSDHAIASIGELAPNLSRLNQLNISGNPLADSEKEQIKQLKIASLKI